MHLDLWMRGEYRCVQRFIEEISANYLIFEYQEHDGKDFVPKSKVKYQANISVRIAPFGIYEIIFPEEHLDLVLTTILGKKSAKNEEWHVWINKYVFVFRKLLKLKPVPDYDDSRYLPVFRNYIEFIPIGLKYDMINPSGNENI